MIEEVIDDSANQLGEIDEGDAAKIDELLSSLLDRVRSMPRMKRTTP